MIKYLHSIDIFNNGNISYSMEKYHNDFLSKLGIIIDLKSLIEPKEIIDSMYKIKMELEKLVKSIEDIDMEKSRLISDYIGMQNSDETSNALDDLYKKQFEIERYQSVLNLMYITLDKLFFIELKPRGIDLK